MSPTSITADEAYRLLKSGEAPSGLKVDGVLDYSKKSERRLPAHFPDNLTVDVLDLSEQDITELPAGLRAYELNLSETPIVALPDDLLVESQLNLFRCDRLESLPEGLTVGSLNLRGCSALLALPENLDVWFLDLSGCWAFEYWPQRAAIRSGQLQLRGCAALRHLPDYIHRLSALNVRECPNLGQLPENLVVTGFLELGHSGLSSESALPSGLSQTQLRWAGVNVDRRIAFHPEQIRLDEINEERNAERRRVLLDRYGYTRYLQDSNAELLDRDTDPGGPRQLLRVLMKDDEDLVAMSCFCPSTGRQYMIRVPPTTKTCHQAAAWIAGFDNADDYQPVMET